MSELQSELGFADARRAENHGQRSWQQTAAQHMIQFRDASL